MEKVIGFAVTTARRVEGQGHDLPEVKQRGRSQVLKPLSLVNQDDRLEKKAAAIFTLMLTCPHVIRSQNIRPIFYSYIDATNLMIH